MALDIKVKITQSTTSGTTGFGIPLIFAQGNSVAVPYTECSNITDVARITSGDSETPAFDSTSAVYKAAALLFTQNNPPAKIGVYAVTGKLTDGIDTIWSRDWRQLIVPTVATGSEEPASTTLNTAAEISAYIEEKSSNNKLYFVSLSATVTGDFTSTIEEAMADFKGKTRTVVVFYNDSSIATPEAAVVGATAGLTVGAFTYKNIILTGVKGLSLTDNNIADIHGQNAITILTKAGDIVTSEGKTAAGEYIDVIDTIDWIISNIEYQTQKILNNQAKVPYTNTGIGMLESATINVLETAGRMGMLSPSASSDTDTSSTSGGSYNYTTNFALREETNSSDRSQRKYIGGKFSFTISGAIHEVEVNGEIII